MSSKPVVSVALLGLLLLAGAQAASAKEQYAYSVKFVCGYNNTNVGLSTDGTKSEGEPAVKFGNYATEINIVWPELYIPGPAYIFKHLVVLVDRGVPVGREPNVADARQYVDSIRLNSLQATMDDCNRIATLYWGFVPTPMPLLVGYLVLTSTHELDVTAVYTSQACSNWVASPQKLECLNQAGAPVSVSNSIDVEQIPVRKLLFQ